jgi:hypothetical protein
VAREEDGLGTLENPHPKRSLDGAPAQVRIES